MCKRRENNEPISYCKQCLSIGIKTVPFNDGPVQGSKKSLDYCKDCGNTEIKTDSLMNWEELYEERYGDTFLNISKKDKK